MKIRMRTQRNATRRTALLLGATTAGLGLLTGCHTDMWVQNKQKPYYENDFFADTQGNRPLVPNTVARGFLKEDDAYYTGYADSTKAKTLLTEIPAAAMAHFHKEGATPEQDRLAITERGQNRFNVFCQPCHGRVGDGNGMIAQRGFALKRPPGNFHTDRLRRMPIGHFYDVISNGFGTMYSYANRIEPQDRWAICAYVRALQLSQAATAAEAPGAPLGTSETTPATPTPSTTPPETGGPGNTPPGAPSNPNETTTQPGEQAGKIPAAPQAQPGNMGPNDSNTNTMQNNGMNPNNTDPNALERKDVSPATGQPNKPVRNGTGTR